MRSQYRHNCRSRQSNQPRWAVMMVKMGPVEAPAAAFLAVSGADCVGLNSREPTNPTSFSACCVEAATGSPDYCISQAIVNHSRMTNSSQRPFSKSAPKREILVLFWTFRLGALVSAGENLVAV